MDKELNKQVESFSGLGISPRILEILTKLNYVVPTPIQAQAIPIAIGGKDVVGIAQTGTGKTLAFGIPMIMRLAETKGRGLVVVPTRELAVQVEEALQKIGREIGLRTTVLIGGLAIAPQIKALARDPHIIVATPGRLNDHLEQKTVNLNNVRVVVLDEADRMLDMGFKPQIERIFKKITGERQTMLFSATMPPAIMTMARTYMKLPICVEVSPAGTTVEKVTQEIYITSNETKFRLVEKILEKYSCPILIFTRTKFGAKRLTMKIQNLGHQAAEIHSNRSVGQRREALDGFKANKYRILVATDIASRGIDVTGIGLVINFDLPTNTEDYVHRIGRTARAGADGHAISFVSPDQLGDLRDIEKLIKKSLPVSPLPELPPERIQPITPRKYSPAPAEPSRFKKFNHSKSRGPRRPGQFRKRY